VRFTSDAPLIASFALQHVKVIYDHGFLLQFRARTAILVPNRNLAQEGAAENPRPKGGKCDR
jgi:hypothetical protein